MILSRKSCVAILALILLDSVSGCSLTSEQRDSRADQRAERVDIGGYALFLDCRGQGDPTVLIDGGAGTWSMHYVAIQDRLTNDTRVCTYDRAGLGRSDAGPSPRSSQQMVTELHTLLQRANESGPLLYVGHSLGGYNARIFQRDYPNRVVGMVLVESGHEQQWERLPPEVKELTASAVPMLRQFAQLAEQDLVSREDAERQVPPTYQKQVRDNLIDAVMTAKPHLGSAAEFESAFVSATQVPTEQHLGDLPLIVLSAWNSFDVFDGTGIPVTAANQAWLTLQRNLVGLSDNAVQIMSEGTHNLNESHPDDIVRAIRMGIGLVRANGKMTNAVSNDMP